MWAQSWAHKFHSIKGALNGGPLCFIGGSSRMNWDIVSLFLSIDVSFIGFLCFLLFLKHLLDFFMFCGYPCRMMHLLQPTLCVLLMSPT